MDIHFAMSCKYSIVNINHHANAPASFDFNICIQDVTNFTSDPIFCQLGVNLRSSTSALY